VKRPTGRDTSGLAAGGVELGTAEGVLVPAEDAALELPWGAPAARSAEAYRKIWLRFGPPDGRFGPLPAKAEEEPVDDGWAATGATVGAVGSAAGVVATPEEGMRALGPSPGTGFIMKAIATTKKSTPHGSRP